ncbi:MAG: fibronectin type III domain-containing protein [Bacteroidaceae bacterium]|nr:fibronectin type III domain-containing protein [Bacteroidaceae bacterium]
MKTKLLRTFVALLLTTLATATAWAADTEPPTISNKTLRVVEVTDHSIRIEWTLATDNFTPQNQLWYTPKIKRVGDSDYWDKGGGRLGKDFSLFEVLEPNTEYECSVKVNDNSGNESYYTSLIVKTLPDTEPPTVLHPNITVYYLSGGVELELNSATDNFTKWYNLKYSVWYKKDGDGDYKNVATNLSPSYSSYSYFKIENLTEGTYTFMVEVQDEVGNIARYNTVSDYINAQAPTIYDSYVRVENIGRVGATFVMNSATDDDTPQEDLIYRIHMRKHGSGESFNEKYIVKDTEGVKNGIVRFNVVTLDQNTKYDYRVSVEDKYKNIAYYDEGTLKTYPYDYEKDKEAPTLSNKTLTVSDATDKSLRLNWTKAKDNLFDDEDLSYTVAYKLPSDARYSRDGVEQGNNISSSLVTGLSPNTTYEFCVTVKDRVGNTSTYDILTYTTSNAQDRTAPTISNKTVTATGVTYGSVTLTWNKAMDNVTKQENLQYSVYCDGVLCKKMKAETSYIVGDLKPSTKYTFEVRVEDEAGNVSKYNTVQATTTAKPVEVMKYPILIEYKQITSENANDFWGDGGSIKYDPTTKTLTLAWVDLMSDDDAICIYDNITIKLIGQNTVKGSIYADYTGDLAFTGEGSINVKGENPLYGWLSSLVLKDGCTVELDATGYDSPGLGLDDCLLGVDHSTLKVKGGKGNRSIRAVTTFWMDGCEFLSNHSYDKVRYMFLDANGKEATDEIIIGPKIVKDPVLVNDEIEVEGVTEDGALLSWIPATDDNTPQSDLVYTLYTMRRYGDSDYSFYKDGRNLTSCKLYNLKPNTEYYAQVRVADKDGNLTFYKETSFKTLPESDKIAPTVSNGSINVTDVTYSSASISWAKASDNRTAQSKLYYLAGYKKSSEPESGLQLNVYNAVASGNDMTSCTIDNLEPETSYDFYVVVYDDASNGAAYTKKTVVTKELPDETAPTLGEMMISVDDVTEKSITMSWSPATDDRTPQDKLIYTIESKKAGESVWNANYAGNANSYTIEGLTKGTDYEIRISVADEAGNVTSYGEFTVSTLSGQTAIDNATVDKEADDVMYTTAGVRVEKNYRGIVIKNGKKVMVKK